MSVFKEKVVVITGGGGTLCSEIAVNLAKKDAKVVVIGRKLEKLQQVVDRVSEFGGFCLAKTGDVSDESSMIKIAQEIENEVGLCDVLINGAGGNNPRAITTDAQFYSDDLKADTDDKITFFNIDMNIFSSVIDINLLGTVICCRVFGQQMVKKGGGAILNFASMNSYRPLSCRPAYALSKAAIVNFTQWLANYIAPAGVRVNAVAPGFITNQNNIKFYGSLETGYTERGCNILGHTPMHRFGKADDLIGTVEWLIDDEKSSFVTGITVPVDGGFLSCSGL